MEFHKKLIEGYEEENHHPPIVPSGRCGTHLTPFYKRVLKNEAINIYNERRQQQPKEMTFSDLSLEEENQLYTLEKHDEGEET